MLPAPNDPRQRNAGGPSLHSHGCSSRGQGGGRSLFGAGQAGQAPNPKRNHRGKQGRSNGEDKKEYPIFNKECRKTKSKPRMKRADKYEIGRDCYTDQSFELLMNLFWQKIPTAIGTSRAMGRNHFCVYMSCLTSTVVAI